MCQSIHILLVHNNGQRLNPPFASICPTGCRDLKTPTGVRVYAKKDFFVQMRLDVKMLRLVPQKCIGLLYPEVLILSRKNHSKTIKLKRFNHISARKYFIMTILQNSPGW